MDFNPKPYIYRGKAHSIRTLHTALSKRAALGGGELGSLSFDKDAAYIGARDGRTVRFPRVINGDGTSSLTD